MNMDGIMMKIMQGLLEMSQRGIEVSEFLNCGALSMKLTVSLKVQVAIGCARSQSFWHAGHTWSNTWQLTQKCMQNKARHDQTRSGIKTLTFIQCSYAFIHSRTQMHRNVKQIHHCIHLSSYNMDQGLV